LRSIDLTNIDFRESGRPRRAISAERSRSRLTISSREAGFSNAGRLAGSGRDVRKIDVPVRPFAGLGPEDVCGFDRTMGAGGFAPSFSNRSRIEFNWLPPPLGWAIAGAAEGFRPPAPLGLVGLSLDVRSIDLGAAFAAGGDCFTILGTDGLAGEAGLGGVDRALSCSSRSRIDFARSAASLTRPAAGTDEEPRPSASGAGGLRCENSSVALGLDFGVVGDCLTIDGVDGLGGTTSFGVDGFVGVVLDVGAGVLGVGACSRNRENS